MILKKIKWIAIVSIGVMALLYGADKLNTEDEKKDKGVNILKNEWKLFDVDTIVGETPASLFGGLQKGSAIQKYRLELKYPFDGKVGFFGGSDREDMRNKCRGNGGLDCRMKNETAYLFRTTDDGETFTRQTLGHGIAKRIKEIDGIYFVNVEEEDTKISKTFRSDNLGKSWKHIGNFYINVLFEPNRFVFVTTSKKGKELVFKSFYTKDGGKTSQLLDKKLLAYEKKSLTNGLQIYKGRLAFLIDESLVFVDIDTLKEEIHHFDIPKGKVIRSMKVDKRSGELYIALLNEEKPEPMRFSIYYPFTNVLVEFNKSSKELDDKDIFLVVDGNYIGSLTRISGVLFHFWTLDYGKKWEMEVLEDYFYDGAFKGYGNGRIYMDPLVKIKDKKDRKAYFIMGHIK